jgi:hypothetical protein
MGFEVKTAAKSSLPADLPKAQDAASQHPDGAIYVADNKTRYRLRHARWVEVVARQSAAKTAKK